ncbi:MAG: glycosyltransferase family 2 protein [Candidatus Scalinduaceae bacterium]
MPEIDISVVVPLYNEEESIIRLYDSITEVMKGLNRSYEIIFVDDGSSDETFERAKTIHEKDPYLKVIKFRKNYGQTPAMQAGFDHAKGRTVVSMDGDLQNDPKDIPKFLEKIEEGYDIVCGWRKNRKDKLVSRKIPSKIANRLIGQVTGVKIHDNGCSLKAYRSATIKKIRLYSEMHRFIPAMTSIVGIKYTEIVVNHHARKFGTSKYGLSRIWKVFLDIFTVKMLVGFSTKPSLLFGMLSLPFLIMGTMFMLFSINLYLNPFIFSSFPIIFPSISFLFIFLFVHMILLGMLSEMVLKTGDFKQKDIVKKVAIEVL